MKNKLSKGITILLTIIFVVTSVVIIIFGNKDDENSTDEQVYISDITITVEDDGIQDSDDIQNVTDEAVTDFETSIGDAVSVEKDTETAVSDGAEYIEYDPNYETAFITDSSDTVLDTGNAYTFKNKELLNSHYEKHGIDMGFSSAEEYEKAASAVVNSSDALHKKEREDNDDVYYIEETNEFVIVSDEGFIRTYFFPDAGKAYYDRQ